MVVGALEVVLRSGARKPSKSWNSWSMPGNPAVLKFWRQPLCLYYWSTCQRVGVVDGWGGKREECPPPDWLESGIVDGWRKKGRATAYRSYRKEVKGLRNSSCVTTALALKKGTMLRSSCGTRSM